MASPIGDMKNVKIFVLYLMANIGYPMNFATINDVTLQNDYVMYLDFAEAFNSLLDNDLVKKVVEKVHEYGIINNSIISCFEVLFSVK